MLLVIKNLTKEILKNKIFLILLFIMTIFTSFLFFFIRFSIDGNMIVLNSLTTLSEQQLNYKNALMSNSGLSLIVIIAFTITTSLLFIMFYFRFYNVAKKQIGVLKAIGVKTITLQLYFTIFAFVFSSIGLLLGMLFGYFASSIPMTNNSRSYDVYGLVKGINLTSILLGILLPVIIFSVTMFLCNYTLYNKNNVTLLFNQKQNSKQSITLNIADVAVQKLPLKNKAPLRIALRKPLAISLIIVASTVFTVMLVLGWSLTLSSESNYKTQTDGHYYEYEAKFDEIQTEQNHKNTLYYLSVDGNVLNKGNEIEQTIFGMDINDEIYTLKNQKDVTLGQLEAGFCYISLGTSEMYGIDINDSIKIKIKDKQIDLTVKDIAYNAKTKTLVISREQLAIILEIPSQSFNGALSIDDLYPNATEVINSEMRKDMLERDKVTSAASAVMNNAIGIVSGIILIFLALFITFQDAQKDILIMNTLGYQNKEIRKLLINVFLPILIIGFVIMAYPAVLIAKSVQMSLSLSMGDYMPFSTNIWVILVGFATIATIYWLSQLIFSLGIKHSLKKKGIIEYLDSI